MSTLRNPVGPQSSQTYWRRRFLVLLGIIAVIIVVVLIVVRPGADAPAGDTKPTNTTSAKPTASTTPVEGAACAPANLVLTAVTDKDSYAAGEQPQIGLTLQNTGAASCTTNLGSTQQELIITSGSEKIWTSKDCQTGAVDTEVTIAAKETKSTPTIPWDRTRSSTTTCNAQRNAVIAGGASYHLSVKVGDLTSKTTKQFILK